MPTPRASIDLNADLGEGAPDDEALLDRVTSASICCGGHAGGRSAALATLRAAAARGVVVGAHPGFEDRENFGRRERRASAAEVEGLVREQVARLIGWAAEVGVDVRFVKPHGALYNQAQRDPEVALGVAAAVKGWGLPLLGIPGGALAEASRRDGLRFVSEGFADRRYRDDGRLVPRGEPGAVIDDPAEVERQALRLAATGFETLCLHGDDPRAVALADRLRPALGRAGVALSPFAGRDG